jgi:hypothetical protein
MIHEILWYSPIIVTGISMSIMIITAFTKHTRIFLISVGIVLANASLNPVNELTARMGFGASWILIAIVGWALIHHFDLDVGEILFGVLNFVDLTLLLFTIYLFLGAPFIAYDLTAAIRRATSFLLVFIVGWRIFGAVFRVRPQAIRSYIYILIYASGAWYIIFDLIFLIVYGPNAVQPVKGWINFALGGQVVTRLEYISVLPGTAVSSAAAVGLILVYHWYKRFNDRRRILLLGLTPVLILIILWGGGRTAMISLWVTALILYMMETLFRRGFLQVRTVLFFVSLGLLPLLLWPIFQPIFMRDVGMRTLIEGLMINRINASIEIFRYFQSNITWGAGASALSVYAKETFTPLLESFFFQSIIEYGILFGSLYILAWVIITLAIIKVDMHYLRAGFPAAWLPSAGVLFIWAGILANYGFGIFSSNLIIHLAIGTASLFELSLIRNSRKRINVIKPEMHDPSIDIGST